MDQSARSTQPASTQNAGRREMMFCHQCNDEWYRDEGGIICPECRSEFTEIIEEDNDPRDNIMFVHDHDDEDDDSSMPSLEEAPPGHPLHGQPLHGHPLHGHHPWQHADDPDEADISTMRFQPVGPGRFHVSATIHRTISPAALSNNGNGPNTIGGFTSFLTNLLQGASAAGQQQNQQQNQAGEGQGNMGSRSGQDGAPRVHRFAYSAGARLYPRDADNPGPRLEPVDDINGVLTNLLMALGEPPGGRQGGPGHVNGPDQMPLNPLMSLFAAMSGGRHGDFVYSQEALDQIVSQLMEQTATSNAPGPASEEEINALPRKKITEEMLGVEGRAECSICMDEVNIGEEVTELPCKHWFHHQCVSAWLGEHDTCPHCRQGITKHGDDAGNNPSDGNATSSGTDPTASMPGAFGVSREGATNNPYTGQTQGGANDGSSSGGGNGISERLRRGLFGPQE